jgi:hypothetical protein
MADIHQEFKHVLVQASEDFERDVEDGTNLVGPDIRINGIPQTKQLLTCLGAHQIDVGFAYYAAMAPPPAEHAYLPVLDYPASRLPSKVKRLRGNYAVIPCGYSAEARKTTGVHINPIIRHLKSKGITPVFLGKRNLLGDEKLTTNFVEDYDYAAGVDLRGETAVKDAACIMQHAKLTVGLDCGLLHLAALMKDSTIIFGYNITTIENRVPRRTHGRTINVTLSKEELPCVGCQTNWRNFPAHRFDRCFYEPQDRKAAEAYGKKYESALCVTLLYAKGAERFTRAIDEVLDGGR